MANSLTILIVVAYLLICILIGVFAKRRQTPEGFFLADRKVGLFQSTATISAGYMGAGFFLVNAAFVFIYGISAAWMFIGLFIGFLIFSKFGLFLKKHDDEKKYYTLSDYFQSRHGKKIAKWATLSVFLVYFGIVVNQFIGGAKVLGQLSGWSYSISLFLIALVVLIYLLLGGFKSVVKTDILQYLMIFILPILLFFIIKSSISLPVEYFNIFNAGAVNIIAFFLFGVLSNFMFADLWQRVYAAKNQKVVKKAFFYSGISVLLVGAFITYVGLLTRSMFQSIDPDLTMIQGLSSLVPNSLLILTLLFFFAVIMSSIDTAIFTLSVSTSRDIINFKKKLTKEKEVFYTKVSLFVLTILTVAIALIYPKMAELAIIYSSLGISLAPMVVISWLAKKPNIRSMKWGIILGIISVLVLVFGFKFIHPGLGIVALFVSTLVYFVTFRIIKDFKKS